MNERRRRKRKGKQTVQMVHHLRANKTVGAAILSPEGQRCFLQDQAKEYFDAFQNGSDSEKAFHGRIRNLDRALTLAEQAGSGARRVKCLCE